MTVLSNPVKITQYVETRLMVSSVNVSLAIWEKTAKLTLTNVKVILVGDMAGKFAYLQFVTNQCIYFTGFNVGSFEHYYLN